MAPETALYCSAMARARQTAEPIGIACGLEPVIVPELHERRMGPLSGRDIFEVLDQYHHSRDRWKLGDLDATHEGGESYAQIRDRVVPAFTALAHRNPCETIVVVEFPRGRDPGPAVLACLRGSGRRIMRSVRDRLRGGQ